MNYDQAHLLFPADEFSLGFEFGSIRNFSRDRPGQLDSLNSPAPRGRRRRRRPTPLGCDTVAVTSCDGDTGASGDLNWYTQTKAQPVSTPAGTRRISCPWAARRARSRLGRPARRRRGPANWPRRKGRRRRARPGPGSGWGSSLRLESPAAAESVPRPTDCQWHIRPSANPSQVLIM